MTHNGCKKWEEDSENMAMLAEYQKKGFISRGEQRGAECKEKVE
jgi:hypothetical protein